MSNKDLQSKEYILTYFPVGRDPKKYHFTFLLQQFFFQDSTPYRNLDSVLDQQSLNGEWKSRFLHTKKPSHFWIHYSEDNISAGIFSNLTVNLVGKCQLSSAVLIKLLSLKNCRESGWYHISNLQIPPLDT